MSLLLLCMADSYPAAVLHSISRFPFITSIADLNSGARTGARVARAGRHGCETLHLAEIAIERRDEAWVAMVRDDRGVREAKAAPALCADGRHHVEEHPY